MSGFDLRTIARALHGEVQGQRVLAPGPGHSRIDRSLSVRLSSTAPGGFVVKSFADDDFAACRDHVGAVLGLPSDFWRTKGQGGGSARPLAYVAAREPAPGLDHAERIARARAIWDTASDAHGNCVEVYLRSRGLDLPVGADVLRFNPRTPWREDSGEVIRVPAMVGCLREIQGDAITGVHKTRLTREGAKVGRKMQGKAGGSAIKLDPDDAVTMGLSIAEGIETAVQGRQLGFVPAWALGSAGGIAAFPVLGGIECLTIHAERDDTNAKAVETCAARWHRAGREVVIVEPRTGSDLNDAVRGMAS